jgi:hypothetical protein
MLGNSQLFLVLKSAKRFWKPMLLGLIGHGVEVLCPVADRQAQVLFVLMQVVSKTWVVAPGNVNCVYSRPPGALICC